MNYNTYKKLKLFCSHSFFESLLQFMPFL